MIINSFQRTQFVSSFKEYLHRHFKSHENNAIFSYKLGVLAFCAGAGMNDDERRDFLQDVNGNWQGVEGK